MKPETTRIIIQERIWIAYLGENEEWWMNIEK